MKFAVISLALLSHVSLAQVDYSSKELTLADTADQKLQIMKQIVSYTHRSICTSVPDVWCSPNGECTQTTRESCDTVSTPHPKHVLQLNATVRVARSEVQNFSEKITFRLLNDETVDVYSEKTKNALVVRPTVLGQELVGGAVVRTASYDIEILDRTQLDQFKVIGVKNYRYEAGKLRFETLDLPDTFELVADMDYGRNCSTFLPQIAKETMAQAVSSKVIAPGVREFTVDFDILARAGYRVYKRKICAMVTVDAKVKATGATLINAKSSVNTYKMIRP